MARLRSVDDKMPFMEHLGELRGRILWALGSVLVGLVIAVPFAEKIVDYLARPVKKTPGPGTPLTQALDAALTGPAPTPAQLHAVLEAWRHQIGGNTLVFVSLTEAFWVQMKVALIVGVFIATPGILWQVWRFVAPGLHAHEKKYAAPFVIVGSLLFAAGGAFSLFVVTPYAIAFMLSYARPGLQPMISIATYIDFLLKFTLAFGAIFELPLAISLLARMGVVTARMLAKNRKYAILGAFIAGAVLTPTPDMFNQTLMAGPLIILYEIGIVCARIFGRRPAPVATAEP
ncbi:MAG: twin-arginine translocase subunit TatC [Candidatus Rokubacteria bacterium]|nr:twin-arginine translocase subunit TatC [Candidatus Rokubacteria bacterium]